MSEPELSLSELQERILAGTPLSAEEYKRVIESHRTARTAASQTAAKRGKKAAADFDLNAEIDAALGM